MRFTMNHSFGPEFAALIDRLGDDNVRETLKQVINATAVEAEGIIKRATPVDSGNLVNSIQTRLADRNDLNAEVYTNTDYAIFVEFGTGVHNELSQEARTSGWKGQKAAAMFRGSEAETREILRRRLREAVKALMTGQNQGQEG